MNAKSNTCMLGIGSVGISTFDYIYQNKKLPLGSTLFVKKDLETDLEIKSKDSISSLKKLHSFTKLKTIGLVEEYKEDSKADSLNEIISLLDIDKKAVSCIVGLGGESGDFFLKLVESINSRLESSISYCIMPFTFEGKKRNSKAEFQLEKIKEITKDTVILHNQDLLKNSDKNRSFDEAFLDYHKLIEDRL